MMMLMSMQSVFVVVTTMTWKTIGDNESNFITVTATVIVSSTDLGIVWLICLLLIVFDCCFYYLLILPHGMVDGCGTLTYLSNVVHHNGDGKELWYAVVMVSA